MSQDRDGLERSKAENRASKLPCREPTAKVKACEQV